MFVSIILFVAGALIKLYTIVPPAGSPFTRIFHVLRAAFVNRGKAAPSASELYGAWCRGFLAVLSTATAPASLCV
jgi:hypothetical protein